jgi:hypothetical protein
MAIVRAKNEKARAWGLRALPTQQPNGDRTARELRGEDFSQRFGAGQATPRQTTCACDPGRFPGQFWLSPSTRRSPRPCQVSPRIPDPVAAAARSPALCQREPHALQRKCELIR